MIDKTKVEILYDFEYIQYNLNKLLQHSLEKFNLETSKIKIISPKIIYNVDFITGQLHALDKLKLAIVYDYTYIFGLSPEDGSSRLNIQLLNNFLSPDILTEKLFKIYEDFLDNNYYSIKGKTLEELNIFGELKKYLLYDFGDVAAVYQFIEKLFDYLVQYEISNILLHEL